MTEAPADAGGTGDGAAASAPAHGSPRPPLRCLGGGAAPPGLASDLTRLLELPLPVLARVGDVLGASLPDPLPPGVSEQLDAFCAAHELSKESLGGPLRACRFLLREAARANLARDAFAADLDALAPGAPVVRELLVGIYDAAKALVRAELVRATLADHGNVVTDFAWRVDGIEASSRLSGPVKVLVLTLSYRDGEASKKVTVQVTPDTARQLRDVLAKLAP